MVLKMTQYPFEQRIEQLKLLGQLDLGMPINNRSNNPFFVFAMGLGMAYSAGDEEKKNKVLQVVRSGRFDGRSSHGSTLREPPEIGRGANEGGAPPDIPLPGDVTEIDDPDLPRYTSALKEYGDQRGQAYSWPTRQISTTPVRFRCIIRMDGRTYDGVARSKKQAKHLASREACQDLNIEIQESCVRFMHFQSSHLSVHDDCLSLGDPMRLVSCADLVRMPG